VKTSDPVVDREDIRGFQGMMGLHELDDYIVLCRDLDLGDDGRVLREQH